MEGVIKTIVSGKGYGFISRQGYKDIFFHAKEVMNVNFDELKAGDLVSFNIENGEKGPHAVGVERA